MLRGLFSASALLVQLLLKSAAVKQKNIKELEKRATKLVINFKKKLCKDRLYIM